MKIILKKIVDINKYNYNILKFEQLKKNNFHDLIKKIIITNLGQKFNFDFKGNQSYFLDVSNYTEKIFQKKEISIKDYEKLYIKIFKIFYNDINLGFRNKIKYNMVGLDENGKKIDFYPDYNKIQNLLEVTFSKINHNDTELFKKFYLISVEILNKIHPFPNNNFAFSSIILDLLLIKNNFLPINLKKTFKVNNIFYPNYETFLLIILERYKKYNY